MAELATGGLVGDGGDSLPAVLQRDCFIIPAAVARKFGMHLLDRLNKPDEQ